ncbi:MAG: aspartate/glutamate racemase family protein [Geminicoccaceae bacterium]
MIRSSLRRGEDAPLGILMLNTRFPRIAGDIGNPSSFPFPVRYAVIEPATVDRIVSADGPSASIMDAFVDAAAGLVDDGVAGLTTSCGFMAIAQRELIGRCRVPVVTSSLCQIPLVQSTLPAGRRVGVLTIDSRALTPAHFAGVGAPTDLPVEGIESGLELARIIQQDLPELDPKKAEGDVIDAGRRLIKKAPDVGAIVLECTNMAPYSKALSTALGLPIFDIVGLLAWWHRSLRPPAFETQALASETVV